MTFQVKHLQLLVPPFLLFFSGTNQPVGGGKKAYKKFKDTPSLQQFKCHHTQTHGHVHTYIVCVFIGACQWSSVTCTERQLMHMGPHYQFGEYMGKHIEDNNTTWSFNCTYILLMLLQNVHHTHELCCLTHMHTELTFFLQSPFGHKGIENYIL